MKMPEQEIAFIQFRLYSLFSFVLLSTFFWILIGNKGHGTNQVLT